jgi:tetratricopeptide (TPR) repeat protein
MNTHPGKLCLSLLLACSASVISAQLPVETILRLKGNAKIDSLNSWYFRYVRTYDSARAVGTLKKLEVVSRKLKDRSGSAAAIYFKGQYLAVKLNDTSGTALMEQGIRLAVEAGSELQVACYKHHFGFYCFSKDDQYKASLHTMLEAHYVFKKIGYDNIPDQAYYLNRLAFVYYHLGNYNGALEYLQTALRQPVKPAVFKVTVLNTIGQCYLHLYKYDSSLTYLNMALQLAQQCNDTAWIGISAGGIGSLYILTKDFEKAKSYCDTYYNYSVAVKDTICISESLTYLAEINLQEGNAGIAINQLTNASSYLQHAFTRELALTGSVSKENYVRQLHLFQVLAKVYQQQHNNDLAIQYLQQADMVRDSLDKRSRLSGSAAVRQQLEAEQFIANLALIEKDKQNTLLKQYFFSGALVLMVAILWLGYNRQKLKHKKDAELQQNKAALIESQKRNIEAELKHAESLLENYTDNLRQKTELLEQVQTEIDTLRHLHGDNQTPQVLYLSTLARSTILTEKDWENFSDLFNKVHMGFLIRLKEKYRNITPAETRLLCLTKLNLSTKEMAGILGISTDAIKKTRQRLRKKMELDEEKNLEELVSVL